ncbi:glycoside hydrolase family 64 protein [Hypoxylon trugodes]|uniref:glycoside hydrolase family 64 protein n=1 Tax=Hypoxylon trugodes TaxID=326681 RepID=UPI00219114A0|nr:glycoside hydrolase family 64 protein [Hypoxylon trugodes]KAI1384676.1 glycoside hydrolase family 64 protein [Hypoxylon trugodes]
MTNPTIDIAIKNNTGSSEAYAYITGLDINQNNTPLFIQSDGKTVYRPTSPSDPQTPLAQDVAISLGAQGSTTTVTIPQLAGGRIWFSTGSTKLTFLLNPGPAVVEPSVLNTADVNYDIQWGFCELTYNKDQLFANITYVDFVSALPIALELLNTSGATQTAKGLPAGGLDTVVDKLTQQNSSDNAGWDKLIIKASDGSTLRALSPNSGRVMDSSLFDGYFQSYVDQAWSQYSSADLSIDTQASWGVVTGRVSGDLLTFDAGTFAKPSAGDIFSCSTGPFGNYPDASKDEMGALGARIAAALNRSTLLSDAKQPTNEQVANYYKATPTNHYSRIVHETNIDGLGYAFPYDDVGANGPDQAGAVFDSNPQLLTVTLGGPSSNAPANGGGSKKEKDNNGTPNRMCWLVG